jgi:hypothetical protein
MTIVRERGDLDSLLAVQAIGSHDRYRSYLRRFAEKINVLAKKRAIFLKIGP